MTFKEELQKQINCENKSFVRFVYRSEEDLAQKKEETNVMH